MKAPSQSHRPIGLAVGLSLVAVTIGWIPALLAGWGFMSLYQGFPSTSIISSSFMTIGTYAIPQIAYFWESVVQGHNTLNADAFLWYQFTTAYPSLTSIYIYSAATLILIAVAFCIFFGSRKQTKNIHIGGLIRVEGKRESIQIARKHLKKNKGVRIHPDSKIRLSIQAETRHFLYVGMSGAGKSQAMLPVYEDAEARGDRMVINCTKGEHTARFSLEDYKSKRVVVITTEDSRGTPHDVRGDCCDKDTLADLLASSLLPSLQHEDFWIKAGRGICSALIIGLNRVFPDGWGWPQFSRVFTPATTGPLKNQPVIIQELVAKYQPNDLINLGAPEQQAGVISNIRADTRNVDFLAQYWPKKTGGFSIRKWIKGEAHKETQILILKGIPEEEYYKAALSLQWSLALTTAMSLPDRDNRIWFFIDELAQLNKISQLKKSLLFLRSKGCRIVLGIQDASSLNEIYGEDTVKSMMGMCRNKFFGQASGEMCQWSADWFSKVERERINNTAQAKQQSDTLDMAMGSAVQYSTSYQREEVDAVPAWCFENLPDSEKPSDIAAFFGAKGGPTMYVKVAGMQGYVLKLFYPYSHVEELSPVNMPVDLAKIKQAANSEDKRKSDLVADKVKSAIEKLANIDERRALRIAEKAEQEQVEQREIRLNVAAIPNPTDEAKQAENSDDEGMEGEALSHAVDAALDLTGIASVGALMDALDESGSGEVTEQASNQIHSESSTSKTTKKKKRKLKKPAATAGRSK